jgi:hypothetical protein
MGSNILNAEFGARSEKITSMSSKYCATTGINYNDTINKEFTLGLEIHDVAETDNIW